MSLLGCAVAPSPGFKTVANVELEGASALDEGDIIHGLAHHDPEGWLFTQQAIYRHSELRQDRRRIESFYQRNGFFLAESGEVTVHNPDDDDSLQITYRIKEGPPFRVENIEILADRELPEEKKYYRDATLIDLGERFDHQDFEIGAQRLVGRLREWGHYDAEVGPEAVVDESAREVTLRYRLRPGAEKHFEATKVEADFIPRSAVRNRIAWKNGATFSPNAVDTTRARVLDLALVRSTSISFEEDGDDGLIARVDARKALKNQFRASFGFLSDPANTIIRARASYQRRDFFHPLRSFEVSLQPEYYLETTEPGFQGSMDLVRDDAFSVPRLEASYGVDLQLRQFEGFRSFGQGGHVELVKPFSDDRFSVRLRPGLERYDVTLTSEVLRDSDEAKRSGLDRGAQFAFAAGGLSFDARDNPLNPKRGFYFSGGAELGRAFGGDSRNYLIGRAEARAYMILLTRRVGLCLRLSAENNFAQSPLPLPSRLFGGGASDHRGFGRRELSPGVVQEDGAFAPVGGEASILGSAELRVDVLRVFQRWAGFVLFTDAGDVAFDLAALSLTPPHVAPGLGLRVGTPVGDLRADMAFRVTRTGPGEPAPGGRFAFHLGIGEAF